MSVRAAFLLFFSLAVSASVPAQEMRGFWVDAFHAGMKSSSEVTQLVTSCRAANCNALFVQVRKRGDAYYNSTLEPKATDVSPQSFDPLADLITKAHTGSPRLEVHAWIVTYNIWGSQSTAPTQATHPYNLHADWLTEREDGTKWDGSNYQFDQAHPDVQEHTFGVCQDILSRYAVDGLHFDYIRYTDSGSNLNNQPWGYHPVAVDRFQKRYGRTDRPAPTDAQWLQFRRDQVTALVRKVYLNGWKTRRNARISAALISYGGAPTANTDAAFQARDAWARVLQDWRGWLREGILDLGVPMIYRDYTIAARHTEWDGWSAWTRDNQFNRASAAGLGNYLNRLEGTIDEIGVSRTAGAGGKTLAGTVLYSYGTWCRRQNPDTTYESNYVPRSEFIDALTDDAVAETYDPGGTPVYANAVAAPAMPWKTDPLRGHLMGYVRDAAGTDFDGATITLTGPASRTLTSDATGFYGGVDLPAGTYSVTINVPGYRPQQRTVTVTGALVAELNLTLEALPFEITSNQWERAQRRMTLTWRSLPGKLYRVEVSTAFSSWSALATDVASAGYSTTWTSAAQPSNTVRQFFRVSEQ